MTIRYSSSLNQSIVESPLRHGNHHDTLILSVTHIFPSTDARRDLSRTHSLILSSFAMSGFTSPTKEGSRSKLSGPQASAERVIIVNVILIVTVIAAMVAKFVVSGGGRRKTVVRLMYFRLLFVLHEAAILQDLREKVHFGTRSWKGSRGWPSSPGGRHPYLALPRLQSHLSG